MPKKEKCKGLFPMGAKFCLGCGRDKSAHQTNQRKSHYFKPLRSQWKIQADTYDDDGLEYRK